MLKKSEIKLVGITALGGLLEYYDFIIFALMADYLANHFFPSSDPHTSLLTTFATFSVGYLSRPLGGLLFGHLGDRYGRKCTFAVTVLIMALSTTLIGCLPSHAQIGTLAPILLILLRLLQGFSIGGEIPGAITLLSESNQKHLGIIISLLLFGVLNGLLLGHLIHSLLTHWLEPQSMQSWGWRLPFWLGGSLGIFSDFIRKHIHESKLFLQLNRKRQQEQIPSLVLLKSNKKSIVTGILLMIPATGCMSLLFLFTQSYLTQLLGYTSSTVTAASGFGTIFSIAMCILTGFLADRRLNISHSIVMMKWCCLIVTALSFLIFNIYVNQQLSPYLAILMSDLSYGSVAVVGPLLLSTVFPISIRYSGVALSYNICLATFGGLTPIIAMALIRSTDSLSSPSFYLIFCAASGLIGCYLLRRTGSTRDTQCIEPQ